MSDYSQLPDEAVRGAQLSDHAYPTPGVRRVTAWIIAVALGSLAFGVVGLIVFGLWYGLYLLPLMAFFLLTLAVPLVQLAVMHPQITVYEGGLWLQPLVWPGSWVPWDAIEDITKHTLIQRKEDKRGRLERDGQLIVATGVLPRVYRVIGGMAGLGWRTRAFGIATHAHADYTVLYNTLQRYKPR